MRGWFANGANGRRYQIETRARGEHGRYIVQPTVEGLPHRSEVKRCCSLADAQAYCDAFEAMLLLREKR